MAGDDWAEIEVRALVADYFEMLDLELRDVAFNKAERNRRLQPLLNSRSRGSIEWKHQNVSAILEEEGWPFIDGYKPRHNYQASLRLVVLERLASADALRKLAEAVSGELPREESVLDYADPNRRVKAPDPMVRETPSRRTTQVRQRVTAVDFQLRDALNRNLGKLGEEFVLEVERRRLHDEGRPDLAKKVIWSSQVKGDGLGYDIESFSSRGAPAYIEVKTTNMGMRFPFLVSRNEVRVSEELEKSFQLFRVFHFSKDARYFVLSGAVSKTCRLEPRVFAATV